MDVDKQQQCRKLGFEWQSLLNEEDGSSLPLILPDCAHYLLLKCMQVVDGGSHNVCICKVERMWTEEEKNDDNDSSYLSTRRLRQLGIITNQGRVAED